MKNLFLVFAGAVAAGFVLYKITTPAAKVTGSRYDHAADHTHDWTYDGGGGMVPSVWNEKPCPQSGTLYCNDGAAFQANTASNILMLCRNHRGPYGCFPPPKPRT